MRDVGRHDYHLAFSYSMRLSTNCYSGLSIQNVDNCVKRGCVFAQSLPLVKSEKSDCSRILVEQSLADNRIL